MNNKGQAVIEAIYACTVILTAVSSVLAIGYFAFLKFFIDYQLNEALICTASYSLDKTIDCKKIFLNKVKQKNSLSEIRYLEIKKRRTHITGKVVLKPFKSLDRISLAYAKSIALPLESK